MKRIYKKNYNKEIDKEKKITFSMICYYYYFSLQVKDIIYDMKNLV